MKRGGTFLNGGDDAAIGAAAADDAVHGADDFVVGRVALFLEEGKSGHDHAGGAVGALHGAGVEEGLLEGVEAALLFEALDGGDFSPPDSADGGAAGTDREAIEQDGAGAALAFAAAVFGAGEAEVVAKDAEQGAFAIDVDPEVLPVHVKLSNPGHKTMGNPNRMTVSCLAELHKDSAGSSVKYEVARWGEHRAGRKTWRIKLEGELDAAEDDVF